MSEISPWLAASYETLLRWQANNRLPQSAILLGGWEAHCIHELLGAFLKHAFCQTQNACGQCQSCQWVNSVQHPDWLIVQGTGKLGDIGVEQVREVVPLLQSQPTHAPFRLICIADAHRMTESAANALLKVLEEPPNRTYWFLVTETPSRLLATIRSRCVTLDCRGDNDTIEGWLSAQTNVDKSVCRLALDLSGTPTKALALLTADTRFQLVIDNFVVLDSQKSLDWLDELMGRYGSEFCLSAMALGLRRYADRITDEQLDVLTRLWWHFSTKIQITEGERARQLLHELWIRWQTELAKP